MKKILCFLPGLAIMMALSGCCANDVCLCNDKLADALFFRFALDGATAFTTRDVDTVYLSRTNLPERDAKGNIVATTARITDSIRLVRPLVQRSLTDTTRIFQGNTDVLVINNAAPFPSAGNTKKLDAYTYRLTVYPNPRKNTKRYSYQITNIKLAGQYTATGCCTCYENTGKSYTLRMGTARDSVAEQVTDSLSQPKIVRLRPY